MRPTLDQFGTSVRTDIGDIPWDAANNRPLDHEGKAGYDWKVIMQEHGITTPDAYVAPPAPVPEIITDVQFFTALAHAGSISEAEAIAAVATGTIPAAILAAVNALPADQRFTAQMKISGQTQFMRASPIVAALGQALDWTPEKIDDLWRTASAL